MVNKKRKRDGGSHKKSRPPPVIPTSDVVYFKKIDGGKREFYNGVRLEVDQRCYDEDILNAPAQWGVHVGDLIAVHCKSKASAEPEKKVKSRKSIWYPFNKPWSPAQVVAIYQDFKTNGRKGGEEIQMTIRWLYRKGDLLKYDYDYFEEQLKEHVKPMVYETSVLDDFDVRAALGKIVITTSELSSVQNVYQDEKTGMPQMTYACRYRLDEQDMLEETKDWHTYDLPMKKDYKLPRPLLRGFECLQKKEESRALFKAYNQSVWEQWIQRDSLGSSKKSPSSKSDKVRTDVAPERKGRSESEIKKSTPQSPNSKAETTSKQQQMGKPSEASDPNVPHSQRTKKTKPSAPVKERNPKGKKHPRTEKSNDNTRSQIPIPSFSNPQPSTNEHNQSKLPSSKPPPSKRSSPRIAGSQNVTPGLSKPKPRKSKANAESNTDARHAFASQKSKAPSSQRSPQPDVHTPLKLRAYGDSSSYRRSCTPQSSSDGVETAHVNENDRPRGTDSDRHRAGKPPTDIFGSKKKCGKGDSRKRPSSSTAAAASKRTRHSLPRTGTMSPSRNHASKNSLPSARTVPSGKNAALQRPQVDLSDSTNRKTVVAHKEEKPIESSCEALVTGEKVVHSCGISKSRRRDYFQSLEISLPHGTEEKSHLTIAVGDIVCMKREASKPQSEHVLKGDRNGTKRDQPWFPFNDPWSVCQVLSIFQNVDDGTKDEHSLEVRWFYRKSDLTDSNQAVLPFELDQEVEEIFETNHIGDSFPVSQVIGSVDLIIGDSNEVCNVLKELQRHRGTTVNCRCRSYISSVQESLTTLPLMVSATTAKPESMWRQMMLRALSFSRHRDAAASVEKIVAAKSSCLDQEKSLKTRKSSAVRSCQLLSEAMSAGRKNFYKSISIVPPTENYDPLATFDQQQIAPEDRSLWTVNLGDVVAMHYDGIPPPRYGNKKNKWFPFAVPWCVCQIVAIFQDVGDVDVEPSNELDDYKLEVRWFYRENDELPKGTEFDPKTSEKSRELGVGMLLESNFVDEQDVASLLGPVHLIDKQMGASSSSDYAQSPMVPHALQMYCGEYHVKNRSVRSRGRLNFRRLLERMVASSNIYDTKKIKQDILVALGHKENFASAKPSKTTRRKHSQPQGKESRRSTLRSAPGKPSVSNWSTTAHDNTSDTTGDCFNVDHDSSKIDMISSTSERLENESPCPDEAAEESDPRIGLCAPFHVDLSSKRSFYRDLHIIPPYGNYKNVSELHHEVNSHTEHRGYWHVKMGDIVNVHWEGDQNTNMSSNFKVLAAVAEVVTIWRDHKCVEDLSACNSEAQHEPYTGDSILDESERKEDHSIIFPTDQDSIMVELRWFYRKDELPGSSASRLTKQLEDEYEEILETDFFSQEKAEGLLAPVKLHDKAVFKGVSKSVLGMPVEDYHCRRFYSVHRKSLVPCGSQSGMKGRGQMHSAFFGADHVLRDAFWLERHRSAEIKVKEQLATADEASKRAFRDAIQSLSLIDASEATDVRGLKLIGREKEHNRVVSFLRNAISGSQDGGAKPSMFVAGPPGTGKTACVKSSIEFLRLEQKRGLIPEFQFFYLNGMEMREPLQAYVKLWEALSDGKETRSPGAAAAKLESYFTQVHTEEPTKRSPVSVVLLDEIDYLVTKKQTVLYNFFDWPLRASSNGFGPRLVVIGISNTLNLPERLKPSVQSRLGRSQMTLAGYKADEMVNILKTKISHDENNESPVFDMDAILFAARKTAAVSGDVRMALQLCKRAAEAVLAELEASTRENGPVVRIRDIQRVSRESFSSVLSKAVSLSTPFEALLLVSIASLTRSSGRGHGGFNVKEVMTKVESVAASSGDFQYTPPPTFDELLQILNRLGEGRLVTLHTPRQASFTAAQGGSGGAWPLISLPLEDTNILSALRNSPHSDLAEKYLGSASGWL